MRPSSIWADAVLTVDPGTEYAPPDVPGGAALASLALKALLTAPLRIGSVLGATRQVVWCALDEEVVVISDRDSVWLPNAVVVPRRPAQLTPGQPVWIGSGSVAAQDVGWSVVRWWDPGVRLFETDAASVVRSLEGLEARWRPAALSGLAAALDSGDPKLVLGQALTMLGAGPGLTPEGDDRLVGAVASFRYVTASLGFADRAQVLDEVEGPLEHAARTRTTSLSVSLLHHALAGDVAGPVGDLLRALTGRGDLDVALDACVAIGNSSGPALVDGILCGATAACEVVK